ncbi:[LSU ribosomal protein L11P]-lysine N-methyltransferase [Orenia metallireducens]|uniref:Ribosomal protein L11 methyltransferase n=1 Tax=Orenia metallireducens TaxID=1413210 RepID=A0A285G5F6_9FIRM|nr:50S ribosomal protein L11 methyltransferase [Orenia metallireducens]PRX28348.1 [LSU ribosomal protein L11P]-lysine N-methyltransferase [Orenia metallireducens]SNY18787.1 [LSU ribosomal protein L11P]-lysine N-methyltransferase [Orenia metallireducens]
MKLKEVIIATNYEGFSAIENILAEIGAVGISKEDFKQEEVIMKGYFEEEELTKEKVDSLRKRIAQLADYDLNIGSGEIIIKGLEQEDWVNKWKKDIKAIKVTDKIVIKPTWEEYQKQADEIIIELDPGLAFGTGYHGTTSGCLEMIEKYLQPDFDVLDIGTGTGILSIAATKLGAKSNFALDIDPVAVKVAKENAKLNQVLDQINFAQGDLLDIVDGKYDLVIANILPHVIKRLIPDLPKVAKVGSISILSGIIEEKADMIKDELKKYNFEVKEIIQKEQWITIVAIRRG